MKRMNSSTMFIIVLLMVTGTLAVGSFSFFTKMNNNYILIQSGIEPTKHILDNHAYVQNKRGFIFSLTFMIVGVSFMIMVALPSEEAKTVVQKTAPQPVISERKESSISAVVDKPPPSVIQEEPAAPVPPPQQMEKEEATIAVPTEIIPHVEDISADLEEVTEGEDDVVYGEGPISDAAIMHFVHKFPDSALKFLFRKQLDGKALTNVEDGIYQDWENRQLTRGKVKGYILSLMDWKEFPKKPLYEIWKSIRDHIYENID